MVGEVRFRVPLPVVIPVLGLAIIAAVAIGFSQVLLSLPKEAAVVVAIAMAANVLGVCAFVALRQRVGGSTLFELGAILAYPVVIGIAIASLNIGESTEAHGAGGAEPPPANGNGGIVVTAMNIAFDTDLIEVPAGEEVAIQFENPDSVEHNISVYPDQASGLDLADAIFEGEIIQGGDSTTYNVPAVEAGEYYFQCDVHPNMNGAYVAE
jgi:plastocyanin